MKISISTLRRLPVYLNYLKQLPEEQVNISATAIATALRYGDVQVRKDLGAVSGAGKPKVGYNRVELIETLERFLGYREVKKAVLVGAGKLGEALMGYGGFRDYGLDIVAAFDNRNFGEEVSGKMIYNITELKDFCQKENIKIGVITVPHFAAQQVADLMYESEIKAIWNFAPIHLNLPSDILVHDENMAASLALLTKQLEDKELLEAED
ncbi:MAG: redox-sensing transcriptional repressor Rex [Oscillospiraceae bacterium]|nr:redox-sensing transcriptional repressor Rex [Oscillospiraceae bacterium]MDD6526316.1 redox-sensing transcriptional repressor Rex [Oscillospiraceae bacterium]